MNISKNIKYMTFEYCVEKKTLFISDTNDFNNIFDIRDIEELRIFIETIYQYYNK